jgi:copper chaperone NosL
MRLLAFFPLLLLLGVGPTFGGENPVDRAFGDGGQPAPPCTYCGMDLAKFAHSRMVIDYDDGSSVAVCSLHCAAVDLALNIDRTPTAIRVGDYATKKLINAQAAVWLVDTGKPGVMTTHAKWAFESPQGAEKYVQENGGRLVSFAEAMKVAYEDMHQDNRMIREKRGVVRAARQAGMNQYVQNQLTIGEIQFAPTGIGPPALTGRLLEERPATPLPTSPRYTIQPRPPPRFHGFV